MPSPPPRVLHVAQPTVGGVASYVQQLASACRAAGYATAVACPRGGELPGWAEANGIEWLEIALQRSPTVRDARRIAELRRLMAGAPTWCTSTRQRPARSAGSPPPRCAGRPSSCYTTHRLGLACGRPAGAGVPRRLRTARRAHADVTVAVSDENAAEGERDPGRPRGRQHPGAMAAMLLPAVWSRSSCFHDHGKVTSRCVPRPPICMAIVRRHRVTDGGIEVFGNAAVSDAWLERTPFSSSVPSRP